MLRPRLFAVAASGLAMLSLALAPTGHAAVPTTVAISPASQSCAVPVIGDPDGITAKVTHISETQVVVTFTAAETPEEQAEGPSAPKVRLTLTVPGGNLLNELRGPTTTGAAHLSGPGTGRGHATETLTVPSTPGTYHVNFIILFDGGIHPCLSPLMGKPFTITVA